jgi:hypothetical protein
METITRPTDYFGDNLARLLSDKICTIFKSFNDRSFVQNVKDACTDMMLAQRVELIADNLKTYLPNDFKEAVRILNNIMGRRIKRKQECSQIFIG